MPSSVSSVLPQHCSTLAVALVVFYILCAVLQVPIWYYYSWSRRTVLVRAPKPWAEGGLDNDVAHKDYRFESVLAEVSEQRLPPSRQDLLAERCRVGSIEEGRGRLGNKIFVILEIYFATEILNTTGCILESNLHKLAESIEVKKLPRSIFILPDEFRERWEEIIGTGRRLSSLQQWAEVEARPKRYRDTVVALKTQCFRMADVEAHRNLIQEMFGIKQKTRKSVQKYLDHISQGMSTVVALHIRRTDRMRIRNADRPVTAMSDGTLVHFPPYPFGYHTPEALLAAMRSSLRVLGLDPGEVVFAVASDDPGWCRENLEDPAGELNVVFTSDYHKKSRRELDAIVFDHGVLAMADHRMLTYSQFGGSAAALRANEFGYNFVVKDTPGPNGTTAMHLLAYEVWESGLSEKNYPLV